MPASSERALPRLRLDLDVMPSPVPERPGILLRDPFRYTESIVVIPPEWVPVLECLDGAHSDRDAQVRVMQRNGGEIVPVETVRELVDTLRETGFLETEELESMKAARQEAFRRAPVRAASHAGSAYPASASDIEEVFGAHLEPAAVARGARPLPRAIVAPHVSPEGGFASYRAAYDVAPPGGAEETPTFVILGTSHYGAPERFGITRKPFETPLGTVPVATELVDALARAGGEAVDVEDYCHAHEHSIELQVVFLQHRLGRPFRIVPVLIGPFVDSLLESRPPDALEANRRFLAALSELAASSPDLHWVLGVDMAHIGRRYGHSTAVRSGDASMSRVAEADRARLSRAAGADAEAFFELVHPDGDTLNWCGYSPLYAFLKAVAPVLELEGELLHYEQWNIDPASVVSFAAMHFDRRRDPAR